MVMEQEEEANSLDDTPFSFLFDDENSALRQYYLWRVSAFLAGDTDSSWRVKPYRLTPSGPFIRPPTPPEGPETQKTGAQLERAEQERLRASSKAVSEEMAQFILILRSLRTTRESVLAAVGWALDRVEASAEMSAILLASLSFSSSSPPSSSSLLPPGLRRAEVVSLPSLVARLYLLSDLLHNSGLPITHASTFRRAFQGGLPGVFELLSSRRRRGSSGRLSLVQFEERVMTVLAAWASWDIFPLSFLLGLEAIFLIPEAEEARHRAAAAAADAPASSLREGAAKALERRAGLCGVACPASADAVLVAARCCYAEVYAELRLSFRASPGLGVGLGPAPAASGETEDEKIDGIPF
jgi:U2-associated protein SR140